MLGFEGFENFGVPYAYYSYKRIIREYGGSNGKSTENEMESGIVGAGVLVWGLFGGLHDSNGFQCILIYYGYRRVTL